MDIGAAANMLTAWIANVHVETAPIRIADMQDVNRAKERDGIGFASSGAAASIGRLCVHEAAHGVLGCKLGLRPGGCAYVRTGADRRSTRGTRTLRCGWRLRMWPASPPSSSSSCRR